MKIKSIDIFCEIIDNFGDIGVVYRISKELKKIFQNVKIRVVLNRLDEFQAINRNVEKLDYQEIDGLIYMTNSYLKKNIKDLGVADLFIEAFGCNILEEYIEIAKNKSKLWINLEYISGEKWIEDFHLQYSLIDSKILKKVFYMPGFSKKSGGVIIDSGFLERKNYSFKNRDEILKKYFPNYDLKNKFIGTIFSYEKNFSNFLEVLQQQKKETILILMGDKTKESFSKLFLSEKIESLGKYLKYDKVNIICADFLSQEEYEAVICAVDFNFTRGEDSFVRGILTGRPFMWHIYLQDEKVHLDKVRAFVDKFKESIIEFTDLSKSERLILDNYCKLLVDYNDRTKNSLEIGKEDFKIFFDEFEIISNFSKVYSEFLLKNCNLVKKLYNYIQEY